MFSETFHISMVMTNDTLVFVSLMSVCFSILSDNDLITKPQQPQPQQPQQPHYIRAFAPEWKGNPFCGQHRQHHLSAHTSVKKDAPTAVPSQHFRQPLSQSPSQSFILLF